MSDWGFIYVLKNSHMPGLVKIGKTAKSPSMRAKQLSSTGVPGEFELIFALETPSMSADEKRIHKYLNNIRVNGREFFRCREGCAIAVVKELCEDSTIHTECIDVCVNEIRFSLDEISRPMALEV